MTQSDPFEGFKTRQREMWASFTPTAIFTTPVAGQLVTFAGITSGEDVLDVGTGTGVVAVTAARAGARVTGLDLTPGLLDEARANARIAQVESVVWTEGDAEALPYPDASFDVVVSQFGHMFAPRPAVAMAEIRRVLRPGASSRSWGATRRRRLPVPHRRRNGGVPRSSPSAWPRASTRRSLRGRRCVFRPSASDTFDCSWRALSARFRSWWKAWRETRRTWRPSAPSSRRWRRPTTRTTWCTRTSS